MKIGLIGIGRIGKLHGELLTYHIPEVEIKTAADIYLNELDDEDEAKIYQNKANSIKNDF